MSKSNQLCNTISTKILSYAFVKQVNDQFTFNVCLTNRLFFVCSDHTNGMEMHVICIKLLVSYSHDLQLFANFFLYDRRTLKIILHLTHSIIAVWSKTYENCCWHCYKWKRNMILIFFKVCILICLTKVPLWTV